MAILTLTWWGSLVRVQSRLPEILAEPDSSATNQATARWLFVFLWRKRDVPSRLFRFVQLYCYPQTAMLVCRSSAASRASKNR